MSQQHNSGKSVDPLIVELERLRESSRAAMTAFKSIEVRLAELERKIARARKATGSPGERPPRPKS